MLTEAEKRDVAVHLQVDAGYWALRSGPDGKGLKLQAGNFNFRDHEYQMEPMASDAQRRCFIKGTQAGITEQEIIRIIHSMIYGRFPAGALYMFPTTKDVEEFSKSRFAPLIAVNPEIRQYVKGSGRKGTDTAGLKKIGDSWLFLRGATLNLKADSGKNEKESSRLRSIPVDICVFDEVDLMDDNAIEKAIGRMGHSKVQEEVYLSNPTIPGIGIDEIFGKSDQRYYFNQCTCGHLTCAVLEFPGCIQLRADGTGYLACSKCHKEIKNRTIGKWIPQVPSNTEMAGWQWSQLNSVFHDPGRILKLYNDPPKGNLGDVVRLKLGLAHVDAEDQLSSGEVYACCSQDLQPMAHTGPCAMGVDVGKNIHVVIGIRTGKDSYRVLKTAIVSSFNEVHDLSQRYNVMSTVFDLRPEERKVREYQEKHPGTWACEYNDNGLTEVAQDDSTKTLKVYRTGILDKTHRLIAEQRLVLPRRSPDIDLFAIQVCGTAKVLRVNEKTNVAVYRYVLTNKVKGDHFRHALNYFLLAASGSKISTVNRYRKPIQKEAKSDYVQI